VEKRGVGIAFGVFGWILGGVSGLATPAWSQIPRPSEERPELPKFEKPGQKPELELPPPPTPPEPDQGKLSAGPKVFVRKYRFTGNTVLSDAELAQVAAPFTNREVTTEDLQDLRDRLTLYYVDHGYVSSGAVLPDQDVKDGVVEIRIIEGRLERIDVLGTRWFRPGYLRDRLELGATPPLSVNRVEERLQFLQQDPRIRRINAELIPGTRPGEAVLRVQVEEAHPYHIELEADNYESPTVGAYEGRFLLSHDNLTGNGDTLSTIISVTGGLNDFEASYELPVTRYDTTVEVHYRRTDSAVIEAPFDPLDISSFVETAGLTLSQPVYRTLNSRIDLSVTNEWRENRNYLLGHPFSFTPDLDNGLARVFVLRFGQDFTYRDARQVLAARSLVSVGLNGLGANGDKGSSIADGQFVAWLAQVQWARRLDFHDVELVLRTDLQLVNSPLLTLEQFAMGGPYTVRGFRVNQLVTDNGVVSSIEARIPVLWSSEGLPILQIAPFFDFGKGWNTNRATPSPSTIDAAGIGLRGALTRFVSYEVYWGHPFQHVNQLAAYDLQDSGVFFRVSATVF